jgi:hypothetical protein
VQSIFKSFHFRHPRFQREAYPTRRSDGRKFEVPVDRQRCEHAAPLPVGAIDHQQQRAVWFRGQPACLAAAMKTMGHKDVKTAMRYQHPEIEIVRTALNQGTGSVAVTKPCSHTPCAGSFVAAIQFPRAYRLEGGKERSEHWCTRQCETPEIPPRFVTGRGQVESFAIGVSGPVVEEGAEERLWAEPTASSWRPMNCCLVAKIGQFRRS